MSGATRRGPECLPATSWEGAQGTKTSWTSVTSCLQIGHSGSACCIRPCAQCLFKGWRRGNTRPVSRREAELQAAARDCWTAGGQPLHAAHAAHQPPANLHSAMWPQPMSTVCRGASQQTTQVSTPHSAASAAGPGWPSGSGRAASADTAAFDPEAPQMGSEAGSIEAAASCRLGSKLRLWATDGCARNGELPCRAGDGANAASVAGASSACIELPDAGAASLEESPEGGGMAC